jgi:hypothetical protein
MQGTQPPKVPVYNMAWLFSHASTSDIHGIWSFLPSVCIMLIKKHLIIAIQKLYENKYNFPE